MLISRREFLVWLWTFQGFTALLLYSLVAMGLPHRALGSLMIVRFSSTKDPWAKGSLSKIRIFRTASTFCSLDGSALNESLWLTVAECLQAVHSCYMHFEFSSQLLEYNQSQRQAEELLNSLSPSLLAFRYCRSQQVCSCISACIVPVLNCFCSERLHPKYVTVAVACRLFKAASSRYLCPRSGSVDVCFQVVYLQ